MVDMPKDKDWYARMAALEGDSAVGAGFESSGIRWQQGRPTDRGGLCDHPPTVFKATCGGQWVELRGPDDRVGWMWSCCDTDCGYTPRATNRPAPGDQR